jgi:hypothetical protein
MFRARPAIESVTSHFIHSPPCPRRVEDLAAGPPKADRRQSVADYFEKQYGKESPPAITPSDPGPVKSVLRIRRRRTAGSLRRLVIWCAASHQNFPSLAKGRSVGLRSARGTILPVNSFSAMPLPAGRDWARRGGPFWNARMGHVILHRR